MTTTTSILTELNNYSYLIGVDYRLLIGDDPQTGYGNLEYKGVTVTNQGTNQIVKLSSGDFKADFEAAQQFTAAMVAAFVDSGKLEKKWSYYAVNFDSLFDSFITLNSKYTLRNAVTDALANAPLFT